MDLYLVITHIKVIGIARQADAHVWAGPGQEKRIF